MGEASLYVRKYLQDWRRFELTSGPIVDHGISGMTGLDMLIRLQACPARRVFPTDRQIPDEVIQNFSSRLIQKFVPKGMPNIYNEVAAYSDKMQASVCEHMGHLVRCMAHNAAAASDASDVDDSIEEALEHLGATSALSDFHSQSARAVVAAAHLPADLAGLVGMALRDGWQDGGSHGRRE